MRLLEGGHAHVAIVAALRGFPAALAGRRLRGAAHTGWQLVEHLRIAQRDILDFSRDPSHESPPFPDGYWPASAAPPSARAFRASVDTFERDLAELVAIANDPKVALGAPIPGTTTSWLGQLTLVATHNSYHVGQLVHLQKILGSRPRRG